MPEICSGIGVWAGGRREKEGESVQGVGADILGVGKEIWGGDWSCTDREYVYGNYSKR